jgi:hypothetical protein
MVVPAQSFKRNRLINGNMAIDQRNNGAAVALSTTAAYTVDRWYCGTNTSASATVTAQRVTTGVNSLPNALRILRGSGTWTGVAYVDQTIETINCQDLAGQTVTVSLWVRAGSAFTGSFYLQGLSGSGTDQGAAGGSAGTWTNWAGPVIRTATSPTTTLTQYSAQWSVPAGTNEAAVYIAVLWSGGSGSANDYVDITGVQLEVGSVATPYERQIYSDQLAQCQRYYWRSNSTDAVFTSWGAGAVISATSVGSVNGKLPVTMRAKPTLNYSNARIWDGAGANPVTATVTNFSSVDSFGLDLTVGAGGLTAGRPAIFQSNNTTSAWFEAAAEL